MSQGPDGNVAWLHEKVPEPWRKTAQPLSHDQRPGWREGIKSTRVFALAVMVPSGTAWGRLSLISIPLLSTSPC